MSFWSDPIGSTLGTLTGKKGKTSSSSESEADTKARKSSIDWVYGNESTKGTSMTAAVTGSTGVSQQNSVGTTQGAQVTEGGGQVTQTMVDSNAIGSVIDSILGNYKGLAAIAQGEKSSGLYNSTASETLSNNLLSQVSGKLAEIMSPTITKNLTQTVSNQQQQIQASTDVTDTLATQNQSAVTDTNKATSTVNTNVTDITSEEKKKEKASGKTSGSGGVMDVISGLGGGSGIAALFG